MNKKIKESIKYLFNEYERLRIKEQKQKLTEEEKKTLNQLTSFLGKENEK